MPTYEYKCTKCDYNFDHFQGMTEEPLKKCPKCKGSVKRLIGKGSGIIFKGKGFYQTDYKNTGSGDSGKKKTDAGSPPCGKADKCPSCEA